ncbi:hypothetical protein F4804DRAFT_98348 [Jackrogersella minutella]|nr:hypothetical protein F4804DRAFT_98348 [Jackrogersella minutella]
MSHNPTSPFTGNLHVIPDDNNILPPYSPKLARRKRIDVSDLIDEKPGVRVVPIPGNGRPVFGRSNQGPWRGPPVPGPIPNPIPLNPIPGPPIPIQALEPQNKERRHKTIRFDDEEEDEILELPEVPEGVSDGTIRLKLGTGLGNLVAEETYNQAKYMDAIEEFIRANSGFAKPQKHEVVGNDENEENAEEIEVGMADVPSIVVTKVGDVRSV